MMTVRQILSGKEEGVLSIAPQSTVYVALEVMAQHDVGALVVVDGGRVVGMFSERDYARKVILKGKASKDTQVKEVMSEKVSCVTLSQTVEDCMALMTDKRIRHLPVLGAGQEVLGIISIGDLVKETISHQKFTIEQLVHYIQS